MNHVLSNPIATDAGQMLSAFSTLPILQEDLARESVAEISGGLAPFVLGVLVGITVSAITNPTGTAEAAQWYWDRANDAVDYVAGGFISDMADGLSNF